MHKRHQNKPLLGLSQAAKIRMADSFLGQQQGHPILSKGFVVITVQVSGKLIEQNDLRQPSVDGIDYSEDAVKLAIRKNRVLVKAGSVKIQQADVERLPFQNEKFNTILAIRTHYFWEHLEAAFTELFRVLKPQGELLVFSEMFKIQYHMDEFNTDETLTELLYKVGFQTVSCERKKDCLCISVVK